MLKPNQASRAGTRCVSTLSSDQLSRKRANDREAQRAIRKRAKDHIESLERRIQELTRADGGDAAALVDAQERNRDLERELHELREKFSRMEVSVTFVHRMGIGCGDWWNFVVKFGIQRPRLVSLWDIHRSRISLSGLKRPNFFKAGAAWCYEWSSERAFVQA